ncbi:glycosyl hydrolase 2 galactose-binding domain-containing protein [Nonomuraea sediminis]|uniref:glycosyl hydrolase 2 galactose-binding domain-containing protein n=1 Tax=Nonomuraea sediminis TaxID=2835864 RepID=UPI001BDCF4CD|nr:CBM35 domain-containing protein [Nonomuraea sediminis]
MARSRLILLLLSLLLPLLISTNAAKAATQPIVIPGYKIQSSAKVSDTGATISTPGYAASGWYPVGPRSTVLAGLLQNGVYQDPFYSTNMSSIPTADFDVAWWYRADFTLDSQTGLRTFLDYSGVISGADVWVNGTKVDTVTGAYAHHELDVTAQVHPGVNSVAFKVNPNDPKANLTIGWIDWVQLPRDDNMGIFRDVVVRRSADVSLRDAHVITNLNVPALDSAALTIKADVRNGTSSAVTATVKGTIGSLAFQQDVSLAANETKRVTFTQTIANPQVWWPYTMGAQPLYDLGLSATVGGVETDSLTQKFGIRKVESGKNASGKRFYKINGRNLLIRGGGWSPDIFLRKDLTYLENKIRYVRDLGLNTIRIEGHLDTDELYDLADRYGILTMPGWECCNKWEGSFGSADYPIAKASMQAEAVRLRNHPSVISFLIGSDNPPTGQKDTTYRDALSAAEWDLPIITAASDDGNSGMKMTGPYDWVPPNYWYNKREGGAFGFNSETSAGPDVPTLDSLKRMMTQAQIDSLWQSPSATQYHRSPAAEFNNLKIYHNALRGRYGVPSGLADYVKKAQLAQYEAVRAQFEAYGRNFTDSSNPSTGVVYWMLNSGWSSLHWQLFDYYLDQGGSYWGAREANKPLHVQYSYDNKSVVVVNSGTQAASGLTVKTDVFNTDGTSKYTNTATVTAPADGGKATAVTIPAISGLSTTYLVRLSLLRNGEEIDRNVYALSTSDDVIDWANNTWYYVPTTSYANLTGLNGLAQAPITATATSPSPGTVSVTIKNTGTGKIPAFMLDAHVVDAAGKPMLPALWSDNAISLWPGESKTLTATYQGSGTPSVRVSGWNTATVTVPTGPPDTEKPSVPANPHATGQTSSSVSLAWDASTDNVGVTGYDVYNGADLATTVTGTAATVTGLAPATPYTFTVKAHDAAGNSSDASAPVTATTDAGSGLYEAEDATISQGVVESNHTGFTGTGFVNYDNVTGSYVEWTVNAATAGPANLVLRYANGTTTNRPMAITVNGGSAINRDFNGTGNWDTWQTATIPVQLQAGTNKIRATATTANGGPNADSLAVNPQAPTTDYQAEDATISQGVVESNHTGFTGTGFVNYDNVTGSYVEWTVNAATAGPASITLRYSNGTTTNRPMAITANGGTAVNQDFPGTTNWDTWQTATITVQLQAGVNKIRATATSVNGGPNVDKLTL